MIMPSHTGMIEFSANNLHGETMKKFVMTASVILGLCLGLPAHSEDGATLYMARGCIGCHGVGGNVPVAPNYPKTGMQNKEYTINQLKSFKSASRTNGMAALMTGMVAALTDADIETLADYLSTSAGAKGTQNLALADGANLYIEKNCIACHGENGSKPVMGAYPRIGGQSEIYMLTQMQDIKSGTRNNDHTLAMKNIMGNVSDADMAAIASWLSKQAQ